MIDVNARNANELRILPKKASLRNILTYILTIKSQNRIVMKQGEEETKFVKEPTEPTRKYIFQKNTITKAAFFFVVAVLVFLILSVAFTGFIF